MMSSTEEQKIRDLVTTWMAASKSGDLATVLGLMSDDVVFMTPGNAPFGKEAFAKASQAMAGIDIDGQSEIAEIKVLGDWAWLRNRLRVTVTPPGGKPIVRSGYTLTILIKNAEGKWVIARDANMLALEKET